MTIETSKLVKNERPFCAGPRDPVHIARPKTGYSAGGMITSEKRVGRRLPLHVWQAGEQERIAILQSRTDAQGMPRNESCP